MSSRRQLQAAQTRQEILSAARHLFAAQGYRATKVADIAAAAGVSPQTIYDSVGSKTAVLAQIVDGMEHEIGLAEMIPSIAETTEPGELIGWQLEVSRRFMDRCGDIMRALESGTGEPELREIREEGRRRHRMGSRMLIGRLAELGAVPVGADLARLADILAALSDSETFLLLTTRYQWTLDDTVEFLQQLLEREVLKAD